MRLILLTHGGADLVIERLLELDGVELAAVVIETAKPPKRSIFEKLKRSIKYDGLGATIRKFIGGNSSADGSGSPDRTREVAAANNIRIIDLEDLHHPDSLEKMRSFNADLGVVCGTNILRESVFSIPKLGSINLHQGLAPYYRGGPPVFWELFNDEKEVGLTVHFVAAKVDTGDIIRQRTVPLRYDMSFGTDFESFIDDYRQKLRDHSAELVAAAVADIASGDPERIPQDISLGKRYRLPLKKEKDELRRRLEQRHAGGANG